MTEGTTGYGAFCAVVALRLHVIGRSTSNMRKKCHTEDQRPHTGPKTLIAHHEAYSIVDWNFGRTNALRDRSTIQMLARYARLPQGKYPLMVYIDNVIGVRVCPHVHNTLAPF